MTGIWIVHMQGQKSGKSAILCCFTEEEAANALHEQLINSSEIKDVDFYVDDFPLIGTFGKEAV